MTDSSTNLSAASSRNGVMQRTSYAMQELRSFYMQPAVQRAFPVIAAALLVVLGLILYLVLQTPQRTTLFASLPEAEKAAVLDVLRNNGTDVRVDPVTGDLTVPTGDFYTSRMSLAAQGLPQSMPDGYSVLTDMPMGTSRSVESMRLKQSQEVELARSINEIDVVQASRVHLAIPERSAFARNAQNPTASVFVQVAPGRSLSDQQVMAIVNLVSSSVANLPKTSVTVVNQNGQLLSDTVNDPATDLADRQLEYRLRLEDIYRMRVEALLTPIVGPGNVSAQVSLDIDFTRTERTEDMVVPDRSALLSEQEALEEEITESAQGVPGAVGNTPPPRAELEQQTDAADGQDLDAAGAEVSGNEQSRLRSSNNLRNYEVSRTVMSEASPMTRINGVHVAVLLRELQPVVAAEDGEPQAAPAVGLDPSRIEEVKSLVSRTVGIDENRGDTLIVSSLPFISPEAVISALSGDTEMVWYEDPWVQEMVRNALMVLVLAVVTLGLIKPLLTQFLATTGESGGYGNVITTEDGEIIDMDVIEMEEGQTLEEIKAKLKPKKSTISAEMLDTANSYDDKVALIRMIVADEAGRVSNVFKALMENDLDQVG
ncbi:flagellar basal-body MS-ring/collar protein FliF [Yoonia vestfoldensis]|jgi:flagellar M-ring protein FliF|uniref:Flagellar M-ring protein n=1 Tax=Yoonia vestfoldensis TaxID=245188 RepID=A0A1Y0EHF6_9RHOB|nr:flagellar basal-body MS-ring/collar protein FliF [Yoonia vestfoldensis]ARU02732.1 flagellar M-ring protein [Yoonia vestfoldensis]